MTTVSITTRILQYSHTTCSKAIIMIAALITMIAWVDHLYAFEHVFGCACLLYLGAYILNLLYEFLTKGIFGYISRKWVKNRYIDV